MALKTLNSQLGRGGVKVADDLKALIGELQGLTITKVAGATNGTKMDIAAMRDEDTIIFAAPTDTFTDDKANITIASCKAFGTVTISGGQPSNADTVTVGGVVYTYKTTPTASNQDLAIGATPTDAAVALKNAINKYEQARAAGPRWVATNNAGVVTITYKTEGTGGNAITLAKSGTNLAVSGATFSGGTATGGFTSSTNLSTKTVLVVWFNKQ